MPKLLGFIRGVQLACLTLDCHQRNAGKEKLQRAPIAHILVPATTGATEELIRSDSRPGLTRYCYKLPDGRRVKLDVMDEDTVAMLSAFDRALDSTIDYISNPNVPARWRARVLGDAIKAEKAMRKTG